MDIAKIFENGRSQAVRLPKHCRFTGEEVYVKKIGDIVILMPKTDLWDTFMKGLQGFSDDFFSDGREQEITSERDIL